jgi:hypothetical protein
VAVVGSLWPADAPSAGSGIGGLAVVGAGSGGVVVVAASLVASATVAVVVPVAVTASAVDVAIASLTVDSVTAVTAVVAVAAVAVAVHPRTNAKSPTKSTLRRAGRARRPTPVAHPVTKATLVKLTTGVDSEGRAYPRGRSLATVRRNK